MLQSLLQGYGDSNACSLSFSFSDTQLLFITVHFSVLPLCLGSLRVKLLPFFPLSFSEDVKSSKVNKFCIYLSPSFSKEKDFQYLNHQSESNIMLGKLKPLI